MFRIATHRSALLPTRRPTVGIRTPRRRQGVLMPLALALALAQLAACGSPGPESPELRQQRAAIALERQQVPDDILDDNIHALWDSQSPGLSKRIHLTVDHARALLTGNAASPDQQAEAVRLAWKAEGLREVLNEIKVSDTVSNGDSSSEGGDSWITAKLRTALLLDGSVKSSNYSIETFDHIVYLLGVARSQSELDAVIQHAREISGVRQVVNYVRH